jgi:hypothetical protein
MTKEQEYWYRIGLDHGLMQGQMIAVDTEIEAVGIENKEEGDSNAN